MEILLSFLFLFLGIGVSIASALLASRKERNPVNWFFLSLFWGIIGLIVLACSERLDKEKGETDTLSKVLWIIVCIPIVIIGAIYISYFHTPESGESINNFNTEQRIHTKKKARQSEIVFKNPFKSFSSSYVEKKVDLNDYLNSKTGWDDGTDWNCTGFEDEEGVRAFKEALKKNGIYWSDEKGGWVIKVKTKKNSKPRKIKNNLAIDTLTTMRYDNRY